MNQNPSLPEALAESLKIFCNMCITGKSPSKQELLRFNHLGNLISSGECRKEKAPVEQPGVCVHTSTGANSLFDIEVESDIATIIRKTQQGIPLSQNEREMLDHEITKRKQDVQLSGEVDEDEYIRIETCEKCRWFNRESPIEKGSKILFGWCHRSAPRSFLTEGRKTDLSDYMDAHWPFVRSDDFCGEFQPRKEP